MSKPQKGNVVTIHYTGTLADGSTFDSSIGREPLAFTIGGGQVIPGFEDAVLNLEPGESTTVIIPCVKAYGPRQEEMVATVPRTQLPEGMSPVVGDRLQMEGPGGAPLIVTVTDATPETITLDANHALAGKDLTFMIELVSLS